MHIRSLVKAALLVALSLAPTQAVAMPQVVPIVAAIGSFLGGGSFLAGVALSVLGSALSIGANYVASKLARQGNEEALPTGSQIQLQIGADVPRQIAYGQIATAGSRVYWNTYAPSNQLFDLVHVLSDSECEALEGVWVDGKKRALIPLGENIFHVEGYADKLKLHFYPGTEGQAANQALVDTASPLGRWTSSDRLAGCCYVIIKMLWDDDLFQGLPSFLFELRGTKLYDPRKDSTAGGTGSHRYGVQSTYEYTGNPAIILYNHLRGYQRGGERIFGMGAAAYDVDLAATIAAANVCEEQVALKGGGSEDRYSCSLIASATAEHASVIEAVLESCAGYLIESEGSFAFEPGAAKPVAISFTDDDLDADSQVQYQGKRSRAELINRVLGTFTDPEQSWQSSSFAPRVSSADATVDGGPLTLPLALGSITSQTQAQRVAEIRRREARAQATASVTLPPQFLSLQPGDWIRWTSDRFGFEKIFRVNSRSRNTDLKVTLGLQEINADVYAWTASGDELDPLVPGDLPGGGQALSLIPNFAVTAITVTGDNGTKSPALRFSWGEITDPTIDAIVIEHTRYDLTAGAPSADAQPQIVTTPNLAARELVVSPLEPSTNYRVRGTMTTTPRRTVPWSNDIIVSTLDEQVVLNVRPFGVEDFIDETREELAELLFVEPWIVDLLRRLEATRAQIQADDLTRLDLFAQDVNDRFDRAAEITREAKLGTAQAGQALAGVAEEREVRATETEALARRAFALLAAIEGDSQAMQLIEAEAVASNDAATVALTQTLAANLVPGQVDAAVQSVTTAFTDADQALASLVQTLQSRLGSAEAAITSEQSTRATEDAALATSLQTVGTEVGGLSSAVTSQATSIDGIASQYLLQVSNGGVVNGSVTLTGVQRADGTGGRSFLDVLVDRFRIIAAGRAPETIFEVGRRDGQNKIGIRGDLIIDGTLRANHIQAGTLTAVEISSPSLTKVVYGQGGTTTSPNPRSVVNRSIYAGRGQIQISVSCELWALPGNIPVGQNPSFRSNIGVTIEIKRAGGVIHSIYIPALHDTLWFPPQNGWAQNISVERSFSRTIIDNAPLFQTHNYSLVIVPQNVGNGGVRVTKPTISLVENRI